jgi:hypothetical protein
MTKYEASEKNAVPRLQRRVLTISSTAATLEKALLYWEIFGSFIGGEIGALRLVAEGEELGSNLLRVVPE